MEKYRRHIWPQASLPGSHRGEIPHFYTLQRGTPTSTVSTRTTKVPEEQSSLARRDMTTWLTSTGRSQGSITGALFGPSVVPIGELRQSHTWTVTGTIRSQSWHQHNRSKIYRQINDRIIRTMLHEYSHGFTEHEDREHHSLSNSTMIQNHVQQYPIGYNKCWDYSSIILWAMKRWNQRNVSPKILWQR
jgi:hypothetical protein